MRSGLPFVSHQPGVHQWRGAGLYQVVRPRQVRRDRRGSCRKPSERLQLRWIHSRKRQRHHLLPQMPRNRGRVMRGGRSVCAKRGFRDKICPVYLRHVVAHRGRLQHHRESVSAASSWPDHESLRILLHSWLCTGWLGLSVSYCVRLSKHRLRHQKRPSALRLQDMPE